MAKIEPVPCPRCDGAVTVYQSAGGRGTGDLTSYAARCSDCDMLEDHFGDNGRLDNATRAYNRWAAEEKAKLAGMPLPPKRPAKASSVVAVAIPRSDFARGYFCAVSVALREEGNASTAIRSMFEQGGDPTLADQFDIELFREHGLMA